MSNHLLIIIYLLMLSFGGKNGNTVLHYHYKLASKWGLRKGSSLSNSNSFSSSNRAAFKAKLFRSHGRGVNSVMPSRGSEKVKVLSTPRTSSQVIFLKILKYFLYYCTKII